MTTTVNLRVNSQTIELDYFAADFIHRVVNGIIQSLKGTPEMQTLHLTIAESGEVKIDLNGAAVDLNPFVQKITRGTVNGMVSHLKGASDIKKLDLTIKR